MLDGNYIVTQALILNDAHNNLAFMMFYISLFSL